MSDGLGKALVIGGGIGGMSAAIALSQKGIDVTLVDIDPDWRVIGAGITISGPTLRAFRALGILEDVCRRGYMSHEVRFFAADGTAVSTMQHPALGEGIPPAGGILRPVLHQIMSQRVMTLGVRVRLGVTATSLTQDASGVTVRFTDGCEERFDTVVGADGFQSATRSMILPNAPSPSFVGQGCWRVLAPRRAEVTGAQVYFGPAYKVGVNPCSDTSMYLFCTTAMPGNPFVPPEQWLERISGLLAPFGGAIAQVRAGLNSGSEANYRPLEALLVPPPWHLGRVGLIGDAIHATTPHLASGAGLAVEDGVVLAEELCRSHDIAAGWQAFEQRRWERCRLVVENSLLISSLEIEGGHDSRIAEIMGASVAALAQPM